MKRDTSGIFPLPGTRLFVILGAYGSGKTEFAVNLALSLAAAGKPTALADLDIVNPYFRSRGKAALLEEHGVRLIAAQTGDADLPYIPSGLNALIQDESLYGVIDMGGNPAGGRALAAFARELKQRHPAVWYVLNQSRPENFDREKAVSNLRNIEASCGLLINGLVNNTHLIRETTAGLVRQGAAFANEAALAAGLPIVCHAVNGELVGELDGLSPLFPMTLHMNRPWE